MTEIRNRDNIKGIGFDIVIPEDNPTARLMYYISCMSATLGMGRQGIMKRLRDYKNSKTLSESDIDTLLVLCYILSPDTLLNKCIFNDDTMCGIYDNEFFDIRRNEDRFKAAREIVICGEVKRVVKIMFFTNCWILNNYDKPLLYYQDRFDHLRQQYSEEHPELEQLLAERKKCVIL